METLNSSLPRLAECLNKSGTIRDRARQSCPNRLVGAESLTAAAQSAIN
jgi:hypothetical protein